MRRSVFSIAFIVIISTFYVHAQSTVLLKEVDKLVHIGKKTEYYQDARFLTIDQILNRDIQSKFIPYSQDAPNFGPIQDAVWFKFDVAKEVNETFYLHLGSAFIDSIALYAVTENQVKEVQVSGDNYAFNDRSVKVTTFLFPLDVPVGGQQTYYLRTKTMQPFFFLLRVGTMKAIMEDTHLLDFVQGVYFGFMLLILLYNIFLYFSTKEKIYLLYSAYVISITWFMSSVFQYIFQYFWPEYPIMNQYAVASSALTILTATLFTRSFLHTKKLSPRLHKVSYAFIALALIIFILVISPYKIQALMMAQMGIMLMAIYFLITGINVLNKGYQPAKFYLVAWSFLILGFIAAILESVNVLPVIYYINSMQIGSAIEVTLLSFALADRINVYKKERENAQALALKVAREQAEMIQKQNIILEEKVSERTIDLKKSLEDLKLTQTKLIQSEKLASLGELTAGIAHEIKNPLNFVNNFAEVSSELLDEMNETLDKGNLSEAREISENLKLNLDKINEHGKRADSIVRGMLQHSRGGKLQKEPTDINLLCEEYLRLAYHGFRAKDNRFNAAFETHFEPALPKIMVVAQDIGRVVLNLINNAFYSINEKSKTGITGFNPLLMISTSGDGNMVIIKIQDNGLGISQSVKDKIFQPFYTTKPTGQGTGLGLSLAYDMIKAHGGELEVISTEGEGATFIIRLPKIVV